MTWEEILERNKSETIEEVCHLFLLTKLPLFCLNVVVSGFCATSIRNITEVEFSSSTKQHQSSFKSD